MKNTIRANPAQLNAALKRAQEQNRVAWIMNAPGADRLRIVHKRISILKYSNKNLRIH